MNEKAYDARVSPGGLKLKQEKIVSFLLSEPKMDRVG